MIIIRTTQDEETANIASYIAGIIHYNPAGPDVHEAGPKRFMLNCGNNEWVSGVGNRTFRFSMPYHKQDRVEALAAVIRLFNPTWTVEVR